MKKKLFCLFLAVLMACSLMPSALAANKAAEEAAETLYELGLFRGTGTNADGTPIFDLDKTPSRNQAVIMLVRLLGKEQEALAGNWTLPFTDVPKNSTAYPYIGYAYANGLTNGTTKTTYSGTAPIRANQYITFVLRAMGYESGKDFEVSTAWTLSDKLGITHWQYNAANAASFLRSDVAMISANALSAPLKGINLPLADKLMIENVFTQAQYDSALGLTDDDSGKETADKPSSARPSQKPSSGGSSSGSGSSGSGSSGSGSSGSGSSGSGSSGSGSSGSGSSGGSSSGGGSSGGSSSGGGSSILPDWDYGTILPDDEF